MFETLEQEFDKEPILRAQQNFLRQKICLMALIESVSLRSATNRTLSFQTIREETHLQSVDEVEHLVMKALRFVFACVRFAIRTRLMHITLFSLKLIKGSIDEPKQIAQITWVQPRVLSREQIGQLAKNIAVWVDKIGQVEKNFAPDLLVRS